MNYTRKLKIYYEFGIKPLNDEKFDELIEFIESIFKGVKQYVIEDKKSYYFNDILYKNDKNENIFLYEFKNQYFWINYKLIWSVFETKYGCNYTEIQQIMKYILFKTYKLREITPICSEFLTITILFKTYKLREITPPNPALPEPFPLFKTYKLREITPVF